MQHRDRLDLVAEHVRSAKVDVDVVRRSLERLLESLKQVQEL